MSDVARQEFAAALAKFQAELPHVGKDQQANVGNYSYEYADLTSIQQAALPRLADYGLSFTASPTMSEHGFVLRYALLHVGGHREGGDYPLPDPAKCSPQQIGSALTYGRRYSFCAVTGIAPGGDDDDGQAAAEARSAKPQRPAEVNQEAPRVTDIEWLEDFRHRLLLAAGQADMDSLEAEARSKWDAYALTAEDVAALRKEMAERRSELTGAAA